MPDSVFSALLAESGDWFSCFGPEIVLALGALSSFGASFAFRGPRERYVPYLAVLACLAGVAAAFLADLTIGVRGPGVGLFLGAARVDGLAIFAKILILLGTVVCLWGATGSRAILAAGSGEFSVLLLLSALGACLLVSATDLLVLWIALELVAVPAAALALFGRGDPIFREAGLRTFAAAASASVATLLGAAFLYGIAGSSRFEDVGRALSISGSAAWLPLLLVFAGLLFRISAVPFSAGTVAEAGAPSVAAGFISVVPKIAGMTALLRLLGAVVPAVSPVETFPAEFAAAFRAARSVLEQTPVFPVVGGIAVVTMMAGNLLALRRDGAKRILADAGVAQMGAILLGVCAFPSRGAYAAVLFSLVAFSCLNLGAYLALAAAEPRGGRCDLESLRGLSKARPFLAVVLSICLLGLAGFPVAAGFVGKFLIFRELASVGAWGLVAAGSIHTVLSFAAYARILKAIALDSDSLPRPSCERGQTLFFLSAFLAAVSVLLGIQWAGAYRFVKSAIPSFAPWSVPGIRPKPLSGARVELPVHGVKPFRVHMGVDLGRADGGMPQHFLDGADGRPVGEQVGRERVPENVREHPVGGDARERPEALDPPPQVLAPDGRSRSGEKEHGASPPPIELGSGAA